MNSDLNSSSLKIKNKIIAKNVITREDKRGIELETNIPVKSTKDYIAITKETLNVIFTKFPPQDTDSTVLFVIKDLGITVINKKGKQIFIMNRLKTSA